MDQTDFDISALSYDEFVEYFFTASGTGAFRLDPNGNEYIFARNYEPQVTLRHLTRLCTEFLQLSERLSQESLCIGITGILSHAFFELQRILWDHAVPLEQRVHCIRSMYRVFADYVANCKMEVMENCFFMWWELVCNSFWSERTDTWKIPLKKYEELSGEDRALLDAMFETLVQILNLDDDRSKSAALHGMGHLHHPGVRRVVQEFITAHSHGLPPDGLKWLEDCRDGSVM